MARRSVVQNILIGAGALFLLCAGLAGWLYYAMTQPEVWTEEVGGGWKLEQRRYAMSHGTSFGVLYRDFDGHRQFVDQFVYDARFYPEVQCVAYGTTQAYGEPTGAVEIFAVCNGRRVRLARDASEWEIKPGGVGKRGGVDVTPREILRLSRRPLTGVPAGEPTPQAIATPN